MLKILQEELPRGRNVLLQAPFQSPKTRSSMVELQTNVKQNEEEAVAVQLKSIREREREAAGLGLCKVEEAADGRDNVEIFEEL